MNIPVLILAGGLGTRLRHLIPDLPKPMAPVVDKPFLYYLLKHLQTQGFKEVYLSVGYKAEKIEEYFHQQFHSMQLKYIKEPEPLGTGGALVYALNKIHAENIMVLNGDTFLNLDMRAMIQAHENERLTIALKYVTDSNRYGFVETQNNYITGFEEKSNLLKNGWINAGVYLLNKNFFLTHAPSQKIFSFEKDFLEKIFHHHPIKAFFVHDYFIDIGIQEDYQKAQQMFALLKHLNINKEWTLFLDRDGVINKKLDNDYVKKIEEFELLDKVIEALETLNKIFGRIIIVTNQQGIGKKLMTEQDLEKIHQYLVSLLKSRNIMIDKIYYSPHLESIKSIMRKPNIGMALQAKQDFPDIQFHKSIMVGDSLSDLQFAHNAGMYSVYLSPSPEPHFPYDFTFCNLFEFSKIFQ